MEIGYYGYFQRKLQIDLEIVFRTIWNRIWIGTTTTLPVYYNMRESLKIQYMHRIVCYLITFDSIVNVDSDSNSRLSFQQSWVFIGCFSILACDWLLPCSTMKS